MNEVLLSMVKGGALTRRKLKNEFIYEVVK